MKILSIALLVLLSLLAVSSGMTKIMLMEQEVEFYGSFGFSNIALVVLGIVQLIAGALMLLRRSRVPAAAIVAITFLISAVFLYLDGQVPVFIATLVAIALLMVVIKQNWVAFKTNNY